MQKTYLPTFKGILPDVPFKLFELMTSSEGESVNYSCQWTCQTPDELEVMNKYSRVLLNNLGEVMGERCLHFSSILKQHTI